MREFNPDSTWTKTDVAGAETAAEGTDATGTPNSSAPASSVTHNP